RRSARWSSGTSSRAPSPPRTRGRRASRAPQRAARGLARVRARAAWRDRGMTGAASGHDAWRVGRGQRGVAGLRLVDASCCLGPDPHDACSGTGPGSSQECSRSVAPGPLHPWGSAHARLETITQSRRPSVAAGSPAHEVLVGQFGLQATWLTAAERTIPSWSTFPYFGGVEEAPFRIDWVLL